MATSSVVLDIRANTQRALREFKTFSSQLDNKFLVSGLKLDVVRNALSQINREFQKSLGEQGLSSAQGLKAAENQAAILTNIYGDFSKTAAGRITEDFSKALNQVATQTGSTVSDVQKTLAISPYLSKKFDQGVRENILIDIQKFQTAASNAGLGDNAAQIFQKFATAQTNTISLQDSEDPLSKIIGAGLSRNGGDAGDESKTIEERTRMLKATLASLNIDEFAKETGGFRAVLKQFSASLFNPKAGLLGAMKEFTLGVGEAPTTLFKETTKLFESIFGKEGFIKTLGKELAKAFGIESSDDAALKFLGRGIRFVTRLITGLKNLIVDLLNDPIVQQGIKIAQQAFEGVKNLFMKLGEVANSSVKFASNLSTDDVVSSFETAVETVRETVVSSFKSAEETIKKVYMEFVGKNTDDIVKNIETVGEFIRNFIRGIGEGIRSVDVGKAGESLLTIIKSIVEQIGSVLGALVDEGIKTLISRGPAIIISIIGIINAGLKGALTEVFGDLGGRILAVLGTAAIVAVFANKLRRGISAWASRLVSQLPGVSRLQARNASRQERLNSRGTYSSLAGGRWGFENQVVARLDAIIRLLGNYAGESSPLEMGPNGGAARGSAVGRDGRTVRERARGIAEARRRATVARGGLRGFGARIGGVGAGIGNLGSRGMSAVSAMPLPIKAALATLAVAGTASLAFAPGASAATTGGKPGELPPELQAEIDDLKSQQGQELADNKASGASKQDIDEVRRMQKEELRQKIESAKQQKIYDKREGTRGAVRMGLGLAGGAAGFAAGNVLLPGVGGVVGGMLGGMLGEGAADLLSDPVLDGIGKLGGEIGGFFTKTMPDLWEKWIVRPISNIGQIFSLENISKLINFDTFKDALIRAIIPGGGATLTALDGLMKFAKSFNAGEALGGMIKNISQIMTKGVSIIRMPIDWLRSLLGLGGSEPTTSFSGLNQYGPSLAKESRMSGAQSFVTSSGSVANTGEFVISKSAFPGFASLVSNHLQTASGGRGGGGSVSASFDITVNVNGNGLGGDLQASLEGPVLAIIQKAWDEVTSTTVSRGTTLI